MYFINFSFVIKTHNSIKIDYFLKISDLILNKTNLFYKKIFFYNFNLFPINF